MKINRELLTWDYIFFAVIIFLSLFKFINLSHLPPFGDESLYLWLADEIKLSLDNLHKSITYGVLPPFIWVLALFRFLFAEINFLILGRTISILFDLVSAFLIYKIALLFFGRKVALLSSVIYLALPLTFFHGRLVMLESMTNTFTLAVIYVAAKGFLLDTFNKGVNIFWALTVGFLLFIAFYIKPLAIVSFPAIVLLPLFVSKNLKNKNYLLKNYLNLIFAFIVFFTLILIIYYPISENFTKYVSDNSSSLPELITQFKIRFWKIFWWSRVYITDILIFLTSLASIILVARRNLKGIWLVIWVLGILVLSIKFSANFYPRHLYPLAAPLSILIGYAIFEISIFLSIYLKRMSSHLLAMLITILILLPSLSFMHNWTINTNPNIIALEDKQQFFEDWTAGVGLKELAEKIRGLSQDKKIVVFVEDDSSQFWSLPNLYDVGNALIIKSDNLLKGEFISKADVEKYENYDIYIILNRNPYAPEEWQAESSYSYPKGPSRVINLYKIRQNEEF